MGKVIVTYGTFDLFHIGHLRLLERLAGLGERLIVGVSSDEFNESKGKKSFFSYSERSQIVNSCKYVDEVFPENTWEQKIEDIKNKNVDIFAIGDDWAGEFDFLDEYCEVVYLPRTQDISSTEIKDKLSHINVEKMEELEASLHNMVDIIKALKR